MAATDSATGTRGVLGYFTRHRTAARFLLVVMLTLGLVATAKIRSQFFPDAGIDTVTVTVNWDGAGPEELDRAVVALIEPSLEGVEGITGSTAVSTDASTTVTLTLEPGWDMARATEEVKATVESVHSLPDGADEPAVRRGVWKDKVTEVVISGPIEPKLPAGVTAQLINARAQDITDRLDILMSNGLSGLVLVLLVLFLSARSSVWVAMGIPVSMLAALGVMSAMGLTINMMSLFALIITLGIVAAKHADCRNCRLGESPDLAPTSPR